MCAGIQQIVKRPTFNQSLKGILSAGPMKSLRYVVPKLKRKWLTSGPVTPTIEPADVRQAIQEAEQDSQPHSQATKDGSEDKKA